MSAPPITHRVGQPRREPPPSLIAGPLAWMRANLFNSWISTAVTLALGYIVIRTATSFIDWAFIHAIWTVPNTPAGTPDPAKCREAQGIGACWAMIGDKYRFITFGRYPYDQQWRPLIVIFLFIGLFVISGMRRFWRKELALIWIVTLVIIGTLMWGGVFGMPYVGQDLWGGLPITLILSTFGLAIAFPLALVVALGRRSTTMPAVRLICVLYIELIRGVPLITLLFMSSVMFPLFFPVWLPTPDKLLRAQLAIILFAGAYLAEVVRAGLQGLPKGQYEAADALGLSYWRKMGFVILPQALRLVIPPLVNTFIGFFKDTSLVLIIGIFDLLTAGKIAVAEPIWQAYAIEVYIVLSVVYFLFCFSMSRYSHGLEREFSSSAGR
jgi:general L-amino acid transport system permease protein